MSEEAKLFDLVIMGGRRLHRGLGRGPLRGTEKGGVNLSGGPGIRPEYQDAGAEEDL